MSEFGELLFDLLPRHSNLQKKSNPLRRIIDDGVGEWYDNHDELDFYNNLFINSATGGYLDRFGADYGVTRQLNESDDDYRDRIIMETFDRPTPSYLDELYGAELYSLVDGFSHEDNTLLSDNRYYNQDRFIGVADESVVEILEKKFILNKGVIFYNENRLDYVYDTGNNGVLKNYLNIYSLKEIGNIFDNTVRSVKLDLPDAVTLGASFKNCTGLNDVVINAPKLVNISSTGIFYGCTNLKEVTLNTPNAYFMNAQGTANLFRGCTKLRRINITLKPAYASTLESYILDLNLPYLELLIINGEEVDVV